MPYRFTAIFLTALVATSLAGGEVEARSSCGVKKSKVNLVLDVNYGKVVNNNGHSTLQLGTKFGQHGNARVLGWTTRGLTKTDIERQLGIKIEYRKMRNKKVCAALREVRASVGTKMFRVYVAREFRPGSCEYRNTLNHENTHVSIYRRTLKTYAPKFKKRLRYIAARLDPVVRATPKQAQDHFMRSLDREFKKIFKEMNLAMDLANAKIDTPENYRLEQSRCPPRKKTR